MEIIHGRRAVCLVPGEACVSTHAFVTRHLVVVTDHPERFDHMPAFFGKSIVKFHEVAAAMRRTVRQNRVEFPGQIPRQSVTHLDGRFEPGRTMLQNVRQIFTRMPAATEKQCHANAGKRGDNAGCKQSGATGIMLVF